MRVSVRCQQHFNRQLNFIVTTMKLGYCFLIRPGAFGLLHHSFWHVESLRCADLHSKPFFVVLLPLNTTTDKYAEQRLLSKQCTVTCHSAHVL
jgi:hypothetical protein